MWTITTDLLHTEDGEEYTGYGISGGDCVIQDISTDKGAVMEFIEKLNRFGASPINAADIVDDFLAEQ